MIELAINGKPRRFPAPLTLAQLIETLDLAGKRIAIEKNGEIVPRSQHAETPLVTATAWKSSSPWAAADPVFTSL